MPESPEQIYARIVATVGAEGRLPMPPVHEWEAFPWEVVDGELVPRVVSAPLRAEEPRSGAGGVDCGLCTPDADLILWRGRHFYLTRPAQRDGFPLTLFLNCNEHADFTELSDDQAADFGRIGVWLTRIIEGLPHIGRVHLNRWGDGSEHMHAWFIARPERLPGVLGSMALEWGAMFPPVQESVWLADCAEVARKLALHEGEAR